MLAPGSLAWHKSRSGHLEDKANGIIHAAAQCTPINMIFMQILHIVTRLIFFFFKLQCLCVWQLEYQTAKMAHKNHKPWQVFKRNQIFLKSGWVLWLSLILNVLKNSDSCCSYCLECEKIIFHFTVHDYVDAAWVGYLFFLFSWPLSFLPWFRFFVLKM